MPGIAWLATHPTKSDLFPWWTDYALNAGGIIMLAMLIFMIATYAGDIWRAWKKH